MKRMLLNIYLRQILIFFRFLLRLSNSKNVRLRYLSSNINEVIKTVLNFLLFFYQKILHAPKSTKKHKKAQKAPKSTKCTKTQPSKSTKT